MRKNVTREQAAQAEIVATGKRWCSSCQSTKAVEGGLKGPNWWRCAACIARRAAHMTKQLTEKGVT